MFIFVSFIKLGKFLAIIFSNILSAPFFFAWDSQCVQKVVAKLLHRVAGCSTTRESTG